MKVVVAIDSFKGSMSSLQAGEAIAQGIRSVCDADIHISPIADGGEGTVDALVNGMKGILKTTRVTGPLGRFVDAKWGIIEEKGKRIAIIEMASAAGIVLIDKDERNPLNTTTYGVGELIREAIHEGCRKFIVGIGGSSTNDGGAGMLQALGFNIYDNANKAIEPGARGLKNIAGISDENVLPELKDCEFLIACDVNNPLTGTNGCSAVYGPQKGATPQMIADMDRWLVRYGEITKGDINYPGTGAAGGLGYAFLTFTNATLKSGIEIILKETGLEEYVKTADIVVTGEGRMDSQTVMGKVPVGVASIAKKYGKKVIAFCGCASDDATICNDYGIDAFFPIIRNIVSLEEALDVENAMGNLKRTTEQVFRLIITD